jgi:hypothetical protein
MNHDVDPAERVERRLEERLNVVLVLDIGPNPYSLAARRLDRRDRVLNLGWVPGIMRDDSKAVLGQA